jgi:hypothetical protein
VLWANDWEYGAATIVACTFFHSISLLGLARLMFKDKMTLLRSKSIYISSVLFAIFALCAIVIHVIDAWMWARLYLYIGAVKDFPTALLHSLGALTTLGDPTIVLDEKWRLLVQLEALNGAVALGLTTALLYSSARRIQTVIHQADMALIR